MNNFRWRLTQHASAGPCDGKTGGPATGSDFSSSSWKKKTTTTKQRTTWIGRPPRNGHAPTGRDATEFCVTGFFPSPTVAGSSPKKQKQRKKTNEISCDTKRSHLIGRVRHPQDETRPQGRSSRFMNVNNIPMQKKKPMNQSNPRNKTRKENEKSDGTRSSFERSDCRNRRT